ncbi:CidA/LrgA family protein [Telmatospirillum sp. J64-1]|uniref:CidA/LrgA family protein n=1 Tax=Telmatospirillum sp. J64-1 TaxID=2502183 RepID=UPI00115E22A1|nr:CidA/LrgA family protein [Telmatospirillum sp. J64-1]
MIGYITLLLVCQLAGEVLARLLGLPLPGPVLGMVILFVGLMLRGHVPEGLDGTARGLLNNLSLLFVPAGVGVMLHLPLVMREWLPLSAALIGSTVITIAVTALIMRWLTPRNGGRG